VGKGMCNTYPAGNYPLPSLLETFYFYRLPSPNVNSLGDDLFLSFAFCYRSLQIATNAKSICQSLWSYSLHFVMRVCKQQQMPNQFAKAFGDALRWFDYLRLCLVQLTTAS